MLGFGVGRLHGVFLVTDRTRQADRAGPVPTKNGSCRDNARVARLLVPALPAIALTRVPSAVSGLIRIKRFGQGPILKIKSGVVG